jgi:DNA repair protein SbcD/Mre11
MRLLHFADLHLDSMFSWATPEQARKRRAALRETLTNICRLAGEQSVDALTCGGDLYEQDRFTPDTMEFLRATFAEFDPLPVYIAPGNHDWYGPKSLYRQAEWPPNVHIFNTARLTAVTLADGVTLWGAAHQAPANTPGFLDGFHVDGRGGRHIALFHGSNRGDLQFQSRGKEPHAPFRAEQIERAGLQHALLGHFHRPVDMPTYTYPGNPDPLSFGETWSGTAVLVSVHENGYTTTKRFPVATSQVYDVSVDLTGMTHEDQVRRGVRDAVADLSGFVRVTLCGALEPEVDVRLFDIRALSAPHLDGLVVRRGHATRRYDYELLKEEQTVRGQFVRDVFDDNTLSDDQRCRVLETGLRALDDRDIELEVL